jgi:indolepyruvate ferredoxin oxidoreductase
VQRRLRDTPGVTVLIYEQTCAAEKRRRRKKQELADPPKRLFINDAVCEGCGDCGVQSNCVAVLPHETPLGRKRHIDQSACNKDYRCAKGFCPSFVGVTGGRPRKHSGLLDARRDTFLQRVQALPLPAAHEVDRPLRPAGHRRRRHRRGDGRRAGHDGRAPAGPQRQRARLHGLCAEGRRGAVLRAPGPPTPADLHPVRIDAQQADAVLACDLVVAASPDALQTVRHGRTRILANEHPIPVADSVRKPDAELHSAELLAKLHFAAGADRVQTFDAQALAQDFLGDTVAANVVALGCAWQRAWCRCHWPRCNARSSSTAWRCR